MHAANISDAGVAWAAQTMMILISGILYCWLKRPGAASINYPEVGDKLVHWQ